MIQKIKEFFNFDTFLLSSYIKWWFILGLFPIVPLSKTFTGGNKINMATVIVALMLAIVWRFVCEYLIILFKIHDGIRDLNRGRCLEGGGANESFMMTTSNPASGDKWEAMAEDTMEDPDLNPSETEGKKNVDKWAAMAEDTTEEPDSNPSETEGKKNVDDAMELLRGSDKED